jgi:glutamyl-Q tRNA(Asp) synthetase
VRIEDLDKPREIPGAAQRILRCLEQFGMHWDGEVLLQSRRLGVYDEALRALEQHGRAYRCDCSRQQLQTHRIYPGTCRRSPPAAGTPAAVRFATVDEQVVFEDAVQGRIDQNPTLEGGDFVIRRRDGIPAYMLAVVVDDAAQGVTDIVRGADLLQSTAGQIQLQRALQLATPRYAHVPVLVEPDGSKLAKSRRTVALEPAQAVAQLRQVLQWLGQNPPPELSEASVADCWRWAIDHWRLAEITRITQVTVRSGVA